MRHAGTAIYIHLVWATWDRLPLLVDETKELAYRAIGAECEKMGTEIVALGGVEDHVHLLMKFSPLVTLSDVIKQIKGASSHLVTHTFPANFFKWQGAYGAVSVSPRHLSDISGYIAKQPEHHAAGYLIPEWELPPKASPSTGRPSAP